MQDYRYQMIIEILKQARDDAKSPPNVVLGEKRSGWKSDDATRIAFCDDFSREESVEKYLNKFISWMQDEKLLSEFNFKPTCNPAVWQDASKQLIPLIVEHEVPAESVGEVINVGKDFLSTIKTVQAQKINPFGVVNELKDAVKDFSKDILAYHKQSQRYSSLRTYFESLVSIYNQIVGELRSERENGFLYLILRAARAALCEPRGVRANFPRVGQEIEVLNCGINDGLTLCDTLNKVLDVQGHHDMPIFDITAKVRHAITPIIANLDQRLTQIADTISRINVLFRPSINVNTLNKAQQDEISLIIHNNLFRYLIDMIRELYVLDTNIVLMQERIYDQSCLYHNTGEGYYDEHYRRGRNFERYFKDNKVDNCKELNLYYSLYQNGHPPSKTAGSDMIFVHEFDKVKKEMSRRLKSLHGLVKQLNEKMKSFSMLPQERSFDNITYDECIRELKPIANSVPDSVIVSSYDKVKDKFRSVQAYFYLLGHIGKYLSTFVPTDAAYLSTRINQYAQDILKLDFSKEITKKPRNLEILVNETQKVLEYFNRNWNELAGKLAASQQDTLTLYPNTTICSLINQLNAEKQKLEEKFRSEAGFEDGREEVASSLPSSPRLSRSSSAFFPAIPPEAIKLLSAMEDIIGIESSVKNDINNKEYVIKYNIKYFIERRRDANNGWCLHISIIKPTYEYSLSERRQVTKPLDNEHFYFNLSSSNAQIEKFEDTAAFGAWFDENITLLLSNKIIEKLKLPCEKFNIDERFRDALPARAPAANAPS